MAEHNLTCEDSKPKILKTNHAIFVPGFNVIFLLLVDGGWCLAKDALATTIHEHIRHNINP